MRVYPSGNRAYLVQYRSAHRTRGYTIGSHGVLTADHTRAEAKRLLGDVLREEDPSGKWRDRKTVKALCDRFLQDYAAVHCRPSTNRSYEMLIRLHIKPALGPMLIEDVITRADVAALHLKLSADAPYQANHVLSPLLKLFNTAEDWGLRPEGSNPSRRIKKNREEEKKRYLSDDEQMRLGRVLNDCLEDGSETVFVVSAIMLWF